MTGSPKNFIALNRLFGTTLFFTLKHLKDQFLVDHQIQLFMNLSKESLIHPII